MPPYTSASADRIAASLAALVVAPERSMPRASAYDSISGTVLLIVGTGPPAALSDAVDVPSVPSPAIPPPWGR